MSKTNTKHIDRRALLKGASIATAAATIPATIAAAIGAAAPAEAAGADPIFAAEHLRIKALAEAASTRAEAIRDAWNGDLAGAGWPMADFSKREIAEMKGWLEKRSYNAACNGRVARHDVLTFNAELEAWEAKQEPDLLEQIRKDNATRLAWIDQRLAERERNAEISGYSRASAESEVLFGEASDLLNEVLDATVTTAGGAWAKLALAAESLRVNHTIEGKLTGDMAIGACSAPSPTLSGSALCRDRRWQCNLRPRTAEQPLNTRCAPRFRFAGGGAPVSKANTPSSPTPFFEA
jgi:hypothetical protein